MTANSDSLIRHAIAGDVEARSALWQQHRGWLSTVLLAHAPGRGEAVEDLLQEVALAFVRTLHSLQEPERLRGWLRTIAINAARSAGRTETRRRLLGPVLLGDQDGQLACGDAPRAASEHAGAVLAEIAKLPTDLREPLLMKAVEGMSQREVADALGLSVAAVESRLSRARRLLRAGPTALSSGNASTPADPPGATSEPHPQSRRRRRLH